MKKLAIAALVMFGAAGAAQAAGGDVNAGQAKAAACVACHGPMGNAPIMGTYPKLAGQHADYIAKQLADFQAGKTRSNMIMAGQVANLSEQDMLDLAAYFAAQAPSIGSAPEGEVSAQGEAIYRGGIAASGVAACMSCHGPNGAGNPAAGFPALSGQNSDYVALALQNFRSGDRSNDLNGMMQDIAGKMTDEEIAAVAAYIAGLH